MKRLPVDVSTFKLMIEGDYIYVDKTKIIYDLITRRRLYFLSRPRRFGKTLLISTLKELFSGNKNLFESTWIAKESNYQWKEYQVIHLDFSELSTETSEEFKISLIRKIELIANEFNIDISKEPLLNLKLSVLVEILSKKNQVVILIDEYDYPILANIANQQIAQAIHKIMRNFFAVIKALDEYLQAIFITGVTKFARTSIFSGMNNLTDISMNPEASMLLGYTKEEIEFYFSDYIQQFTQKEKTSNDQILEKIQDWYNGYQFTKENIKVYNPFSVLRCFDTKEFKNFWLETGTPYFLIELLKKQYREIEDIETAQLSSESLGSFEVEDIPLIPILFQTGYLTISHYNTETGLYKLDYPNNEVRISFKKYILVSITQTNPRNIEKTIIQFKEALRSNNIELFCNTLKSLLANIPYQLHVENEAYYHSLLHILIDLLGIEGQSEISTSKGRIDLVIETKQRIFIFELKFRSAGQKALDQINKKQYYEKYLRLKKQITLVGLSFNIKNKELILDWVQQDIN
jgi:hypothetical protein